MTEQHDVPAEKRLDVLHDHYKDTFGYIRAREQSRDRLFAIVIVLFGALAIQVQYPARVNEAAQTLVIAGVTVDLMALPLPAVLDATWVALLAVVLKYCQLCVNVERQYVYLHTLESTLTAYFGGDLYTREGSSYAKGYPLLLNWAWVCYVFVFPALVLLSAVGLQVVMWRDLDYRWPHDVFGALCALAIVASIFFYRVAPFVVERARESPTKEPGEPGP